MHHHSGQREATWQQVRERQARVTVKSVLTIYLKQTLCWKVVCDGFEDNVENDLNLHHVRSKIVKWEHVEMDRQSHTF